MAKPREDTTREAGAQKAPIGAESDPFQLATVKQGRDAQALDVAL
jgi:hypothetical protein